ncbi:MAG: hypothetical protein HQL06_03100 [Nitrospirae bacterium]|nr:hypothetical protein [Nitrospirota bacterium]
MTHKDIISSGKEVLNETWLYSVASVQYTGLLSYSYMRRGMDLIAPSLGYVTAPIGQSLKYVATPVGYVGQWLKKFRTFFKNIDVERDKKMEVIEERVRRIEERLANIEKHGIVVSNDTMTIIKKEVDEYKKALLRGVLQDNIMLREET